MRPECIYLKTKTFLSLSLPALSLVLFFFYSIRTQAIFRSRSPSIFFVFILVYWLHYFFFSHCNIDVGLLFWESRLSEWMLLLGVWVCLTPGLQLLTHMAFIVKWTQIELHVPIGFVAFFLFISIYFELYATNCMHFGYMYFSVRFNVFLSLRYTNDSLF